MSTAAVTTSCCCPDKKSAVELFPRLKFICTKTLLYQAALSHCFHCVELLLKVHKLDANETDPYGITVLCYLCSEREVNLKMVRLLLDCGAFVNGVSTYFNPLNMAARTSFIYSTNRDTVCLLLDRGATVSDDTKSNVLDLHKSRKKCLRSTLAFLRIRRHVITTLTGCRDTHTVIAKMMWSMRWNREWLLRRTTCDVRPSNTSVGEFSLQ